MFGFLQTLAKRLGLRLESKKASGPSLRVVAGGKDEKAAELRGRGTGRGQTPPTAAKRSAARGAKSRKK